MAYEKSYYDLHPDAVDINAKTWIMQQLGDGTQRRILASNLNLRPTLWQAVWMWVREFFKAMFIVVSFVSLMAWGG